MTPGWQTRVSPVTRVVFRGQRVHVKRDDVFHLAGNKMRKLYWFLQQNDRFYRDAHLVSFGGAQSNAMLAIAQLAAAKRVPFTYFSRALDLKSPLQPARNSNLSTAKALGMHHCELSVNDYRELAASKDLACVADRFLSTSSADQSENLVFIPQGAAFVHAEEGLCELAHELNTYCLTGNTSNNSASFSVVVPCGTGATAFFLSQHLDPSIRILAVPCVGDNVYLQDQFQTLAEHLESHERLVMPEILIPSHKARFGRLSPPLLDMYYELLDATQIEFDLLYACFAWQTLFEPGNLAIAQESARELLYVHTGGVSGNGSMLARYQSKARLIRRTT